MAKLTLCSRKIFDGDHPQIFPGTVTLEDGRIVSVARGALPQAPDAGVEDLGEQLLMPGLIDCHVHLLMTRQPFGRASHRNTTQGVIAALGYLRQAIQSGVTTLRDCGSENDGIFALRDAAELGVILSPRIIACGPAIGAVGGHAPQISEQATGSEQFSAKVRELVDRGADWIKLMVTGGTSTPGEDIEDVQLTRQELLAAIQTAHQLGKKATAHLSNLPGIKLALQCGIDCIEHAVELDGECLALMKQNPTAAVHCICLTNREAEDPSLDVPDDVRQKAAQIAAKQKASFQTTLAAEILTALGTDADGVGHPFGESVHQELAYMCGLGLSPLEALRTATASAGEALGLPLGKIAPGYAADLIALDGAPDQRIQESRKIRSVMKAGQWVYQAK